MPETMRISVPDGEQAAWVFRPEGRPRSVMLCLAGGTYDKRYWHLEVPGLPEYSFAEQLASRGHLVVALDHLGVGDSSTPDVPTIGLELLARNDAHVAGRIRGLLDVDAPLIGVGHSMGACLTTMVAAEARPFGAVALLGYGVDITGVRSNGPESGVDGDAAERGFREATGVGSAATGVVPRDLLRALFHAPDVPDQVVAADDAAQSRVPVRAASEVTTPGFVRPYAEKVDVPVLLGLGGGLDVSPDPWGEPAAYRSSVDITLHVVPGSHHCHNMSSARASLWDRIDRWARSLA